MEQQRNDDDQSPRDQRLNNICSWFQHMSDFGQRVQNLQTSDDFLADLGLNTEVFRVLQDGDRMYSENEVRDITLHLENVLEHEGKIVDLENEMRILGQEEEEAVENEEITFLRQQLDAKDAKIRELEDDHMDYQIRIDRTMELLERRAIERHCGSNCQDVLPQTVKENRKLNELLDKSRMDANDIENISKLFIEGIERDIFLYKLRVRNAERIEACLQLEIQEAKRFADHWNQQAHLYGQLLYDVFTPPLLDFNCEPHNVLMDPPEEPSGPEIVSTTITVADILEAFEINAEESNDEQN